MSYLSWIPKTQYYCYRCGHISREFQSVCPLCGGIMYSYDANDKYGLQKLRNWIKHGK